MGRVDAQLTGGAGPVKDTGQFAMMAGVGLLLAEMWAEKTVSFCISIVLACVFPFPFGRESIVRKRKARAAYARAAGPGDIDEIVERSDLGET